jgi:hypothetical protein
MRVRLRINCHASVLSLQLAPNIGQDKRYTLGALSRERSAGIPPSHDSRNERVSMRI